MIYPQPGRKIKRNQSIENGGRNLHIVSIVNNNNLISWSLENIMNIFVYPHEKKYIIILFMKIEKKKTYLLAVAMSFFPSWQQVKKRCKNQRKRRKKAQRTRIMLQSFPNHRWKSERDNPTPIKKLKLEKKTLSDIQS